MKNAMKKWLMVLMILCSGIGAHAQVREITREDWDNISSRMNKPVVLDFCAAWCGPCRQYAPIVEKVSYEFCGQADFYRVDVDRNRAWCEELGIESVPTTVIVYTSDGDYLEKEGSMDAPALRGAIKRALRMSDF